MLKMRKLLPLLVVGLVLALCVVPVGAADDSDPVYSPLLFDTISTNYSDVAYPWPYNAIDYASQQVQFTFDFDGFLGDYSVLSDNSVFGTFTMPELQAQHAGFSVILSKQSPQFVDTSALTSFKLSAGSVAEWGNVSISYNVWEPVLNASGTGYILSPSFKEVSTAVSNGNLSLGVLILSQIPSSGDYVLISDLVVRYTIPTYSGSISQVAVTYNFVRDPDYAAVWFNERSLIHQIIDVSEFGMFDWLLNSIQSFLDFQIVPDLSLNGLFVVVVVVGVLFWFITLLI